MALPKNLNDLGIQTNAISSSLGPTQQAPETPDLQKLLGTTGAGAMQRAQTAEEQIEELQNKGLLERILSPEALLAAGGAVAGGLTGGVAPAVGMGAMGLVDLLQGGGDEEQVAALREERDEAVDQLDKAQARVTNILNTNPDMFVDPETGESTVDPETLGLLTTGFPVNLFPQTRRKLNSKEEGMERRHEMLVDVLKETQDPSDSRVIVDAVFRNMDWDAPEPVVNSIVNTMGKAEFTPTMANIIAQNATNAPDVFTHAAQNNLPLEDVTVMRMIDWRKEEPEMPTDTENKLMLIDQFNTWLQKNKEEAAKIRNNSTTDAEFYQQAIEEAFAENPGDVQQLKLYLKVNEDKGALFLKAYEEFTEKHSLAATISGYDQLPALTEMTQEELIKFFARGAAETMNARREEMLKANAEEDVKWMNRIKQEIMKITPGAGARKIHAARSKIFEKAREKALRPDGNIDRDKFEEAVEEELNIYREQMVGG